MEPQNFNVQGTAPVAPPIPEAGRKPIGPIVGTIVILLLLILGGLYFWGSQLNNTENSPPYILGDNSEALPPTSSSDAISDIDADISATNLDTFEAEIDADIKAAESSL